MTDILTVPTTGGKPIMRSIVREELSAAGRRALATSWSPSGE